MAVAHVVHYLNGVTGWIEGYKGSRLSDRCAFDELKNILSDIDDLYEIDKLLGRGNSDTRFFRTYDFLRLPQVSTASERALFILEDEEDDIRDLILSNLGALMDEDCVVASGGTSFIDDLNEEMQANPDIVASLASSFEDEEEADEEDIDEEDEEALSEMDEEEEDEEEPYSEEEEDEELDDETLAEMDEDEFDEEAEGYSDLASDSEEEEPEEESFDEEPSDDEELEEDSDPLFEEMDEEEDEEDDVLSEMDEEEEEYVNEEDKEGTDDSDEGEDDELLSEMDEEEEEYEDESGSEESDDEDDLLAEMDEEEEEEEPFDEEEEDDEDVLSEMDEDEESVDGEEDSDNPFAGKMLDNDDFNSNIFGTNDAVSGKTGYNEDGKVSLVSGRGKGYMSSPQKVADDKLADVIVGASKLLSRVPVNLAGKTKQAVQAMKVHPGDE